jgi:hypothetical protein
MATKAQLFRYQAERTGPKLPKAPPKTRRASTVDTSRAGVSATDRRSAPRSQRSESVAKRATYELEPGGSRKSTRGSANRTKTDSQMRVKRRMAEARPGAR